MTGFELYEKLIALQPSLKVLFISAYELVDRKPFLQKHSELSTDCFLRKPLSATLLLQEVVQRMNRV